MKTKFFIMFYFWLSCISLFSQDKIKEERFLSIGGIEQWITIKGENLKNPVILFIHGGPGSTLSHYKENIFSEWSKEFTIVHWDQRGAGKTFGKNAPNEINEEFYLNNPLEVEKMTDDGIELAQHLIKYLNKRKIIIVGTSWGSILATKMVLKQPELFHAYIGHAQFVNFSNNVENAYSKVLELAEKNIDSTIIEKLITLGKPPYTKAKNYGQLFKMIKKYEKETSKEIPTSWWQIAPTYDNNKDSRDRYNGDDYSFLNFVGDQQIGIKSMVSEINFIKNGLTFHLPVIMVQGENDILTSQELNKPYFEKLRAPRKEYHMVQNAAHGFDQAVIKNLYNVILDLRVQN
ncbi:alpha/beta hydrolase [Maribacter hydrothermalis]|uniref:Proline iminopeptidase n=1 Tax=Maribacter hydrothermalis TaxID=1836467 RepID=A0A1B7Z831_9FLAO|nr:alpha/beta fold hydrolase [Maribacter hydrothermalis]APQ19117.1 hypothetical protein BTR34_18100 [Maribacter hydrothermalis]OBR38871.1 hypothetical protein A9200_04185 [Maribacter hydrothermalis]